MVAYSLSRFFDNANSESAKSVSLLANSVEPKPANSANVINGARPVNVVQPVAVSTLATLSGQASTRRKKTTDKHADVTMNATSDRGGAPGVGFRGSLLSAITLDTRK